MRALASHGLAAPDDYVSDNLVALGVSAELAQEVWHSDARGEVVRLPDGNCAIEQDGRLLGCPTEARDLGNIVSGLTRGQVLIVFGLGVGSTACALRALTDHACIVMEPDPGLLRTALASGPLALGGASLVGSEQELTEAFRNLRPRPPSALVVFTPGYAGAFQAEAASLRRQVTSLVQRVNMSKNTVKARARGWIRDVLNNLELLSEASLIQALSGAYAGVPAYIVGAGPSLDKNVDLLRSATDHGLVFASNSSAPALAHHGVLPQLLCCIESIDVSGQLRDNPIIDHAVRAFSLAAHPNTLRTGDGPLLPFFEDIPQYSRPLAELTGVAGLRVCGSVSTAAFSMALAFGCSPIVLVGQDLAYDGGRTYAANTGYETSTATADVDGIMRLSWNDKLQQVHGERHGPRPTEEPLALLPRWGGGEAVQSGASLAAVHSWFADAAHSLATTAPNVCLINATEGGASIPGFADQPLREVLARFAGRKVTPADLVDAARTRRPPLQPARILAWLNHQTALVRETQTEAGELRRTSTAAMRAIEARKSHEVRSAFRSLDQAESRLRVAVRKTPLVDAWAHALLDDLVQPEDAKTSADPRRAAHASVSLGGRVADTVGLCAQELEHMLNDLAGQYQDSTGPTKGTSTCRY